VWTCEDHIDLVDVGRPRRHKHGDLGSLHGSNGTAAQNRVIPVTQSGQRKPDLMFGQRLEIGGDMKLRRMKVRKAALVATGVVMVTSLGLSSGAGGGSASAPVKAGEIWTFEVRGPMYIPCEQDVFASNDKFKEKMVAGSNSAGDRGTWVLGGNTSISMDWKAGTEANQVFGGSFVSSKGRYVGTVDYGPGREKALLLDKAVGGC
jgi:hypothetical protein